MLVESNWYYLLEMEEQFTNLSYDLSHDSRIGKSHEEFIWIGVTNQNQWRSSSYLNLKLQVENTKNSQIYTCCCSTLSSLKMTGITTATQNNWSSFYTNSSLWP